VEQRLRTVQREAAWIALHVNEVEAQVTTQRQTKVCGLGLKFQRRRQTSLVRQGWRVEDEAREGFRTSQMEGKSESQVDVQHQTFGVKD
jgi:hypothetical protein